MPSLMSWLRMAAASVVCTAAIAHAAGTGHLDNPMLPEGCGSCHVGHGQSEEPMLAKTEEQFCYQCHGSDDESTRMQSSGRLSPLANPAKVEAAFDKPYRHPVERTGSHQPGERLPSLTAGQTSRHAECVDCHNPHRRPLEIGRQGVPGFSAAGTRLDEASTEFEICLKCHSEDRTIDGRNENLRLLMGPGARSSHPVATPFTGINSPSLTGDAVGMRQMNCSDCHGNDDPNGAQGPHGSNYANLLKSNYDTSPSTDESEFAYALCYRCHDRASLLRNESFPYHREHILGNPIESIPGTSCASCHDAHGSLDAGHLINFNPQVAGPTQFGPARFVDLGNQHGECYVTCHGKSHTPARY